MAEGTIGTDTSPTAKPRPSSLSPAITPLAASRPKAEPPEITSASMSLTHLSGSRRAISRVPGAPPMIDTPAVKGLSAVRTVTPDLS